jgi:lipopolysaccharide biosynthesis glycosyltransferase
VYKERLSQYDLSTDKVYVCAGVTLWNLKLIRDDKMYDKLLKFASENKIHADQNTINYVFKHRILAIPIRYGGSYSLRRCLKWYKQSGHIAYGCTKQDIEIELNNMKINHSIVPKPWKVSWLKAYIKKNNGKPLFYEWKTWFKKIHTESRKIG